MYTRKDDLKWLNDTTKKDASSAYKEWKNQNVKNTVPNIWWTEKQVKRYNKAILELITENMTSVG